MALLAPDSQGNTIAHLVAASGNTEVFEVYNTHFATVIAAFDNQDYSTKNTIDYCFRICMYTTYL